MTGAPIKYTFLENGQESCSIINYVLPHTFYERAFREAGFVHFGFSSMSLSLQGNANFPPGHWDLLLESGCITGIFACKD